MTITSGLGAATTSGKIKLSSADAGDSGVSGGIEFSTGTSSSGDSGTVSVTRYVLCICWFGIS